MDRFSNFSTPRRAIRYMNSFYRQSAYLLTAECIFGKHVWVQVELNPTAYDVISSTVAVICALLT